MEETLQFEPALVPKLLTDAAQETETLASEEQSHVQGRCPQSGL